VTVPGDDGDWALLPDAPERSRLAESDIYVARRRR